LFSFCRHAAFDAAAISHFIFIVFAISCFRRLPTPRHADADYATPPRRLRRRRLRRLIRLFAFAFLSLLPLCFSLFRFRFLSTLSIADDFAFDFAAAAFAISLFAIFIFFRFIFHAFAPDPLILPSHAALPPLFAAFSPLLSIRR
jgi:hypothetical protein